MKCVTGCIKRVTPTKSQSNSIMLWSLSHGRYIIQFHKLLTLVSRDQIISFRVHPPTILPPESTLPIMIEIRIAASPGIQQGWEGCSNITVIYHHPPLIREGLLKTKRKKHKFFVLPPERRPTGIKSLFYLQNNTLSVVSTNECCSFIGLL